MIAQRHQWRLALRGLRRDRRRNALSVLVLGITFAAIILVQGYTYRYARHLAANAAYVNHVGHAALYRRAALEHYLEAPAKYLLKPDDARRLTAWLAAFPEVEFVGQYMVGVGMLNNGCKSIPFIGLGVDPDVEPRIRANPQLKRWLALADYTPMSALGGGGSGVVPVVITPSMAKALGKPRVAAGGDGAPQASPIDCGTPEAAAQIARDPGAQILGVDVHGETFVYDATIVQQYSTGREFTEDYALSMPLPRMRQLLGAEGATYLAIFLKDGVDAAAFASRAAAVAPAEVGKDFEIFPALSDQLDPLNFGTVRWQGSVVLFVTAMLSAIVFALTFSFLGMAIVERKPEIGVLRAIGFPPGSVFGILLKESVLTSLLGIGLGGLTAAVSAWIVDRAAVRYRPPATPSDMLLLVDINSAHVIAAAAAILLTATAAAGVLIWGFVNKRSLVELLG